MHRGQMPDYVEAYVQHRGIFYRVLEFCDLEGEPVDEPAFAETLLVDYGDGYKRFAPAYAGHFVTRH